MCCGFSIADSILRRTELVEAIAPERLGMPSRAELQTIKSV